MKGESFLEIWKKKGLILEGLKNSIFKSEHVEEIAKQREAICNTCEYIDRSGKDCMIPGSQPCCSLCGCCLHMKQRSLSSECDKKFWTAVLSEQEEDLLNDQLNKGI